MVDFGGIDAVSLPASRLLQRSQQPPFSPGYKRVFVAPGPPSLELAPVRGGGLARTTFDREAFAADPRIAALHGERA